MSTIVAEIGNNNNQVPTKKGRNRKALKLKNTVSEVNISVGKQVSADIGGGKENQAGVPLILSPINAKNLSKTTESKQDFEKELQGLQSKLEKMRLEKEKTEELLKQKDELLKLKEEEIESRGKEQERIQTELKKLQRLKEFKPVLSFPLVQSLREKQEDKRQKKQGKRRPCPPYSLWCKEQWNEVRKENPNAEFKEISNIMGARWKNMSEVDKKPYELKYQAEKESYLKIVGKEKRENEAMKLLEEEQKQKTAMELLDQYLLFKQELDEQMKKKKNKSKKPRDPLKPKQPLSAFFFYSNDRRAAMNGSKNVLEIAKIAGDEWKNMTEEQRMPYDEMARKQKEEYLQQLEIYRQNKDAETAKREREEAEQNKLQKQEALQLLKKKEKTQNIIKKSKEARQKKKKNSDPNRPKKPASSFLLFSMETRKSLIQERPGINNSTMNAMISVKWKELSEEERKIWDEKAAEAMATYRKELEEYNKTLVHDKEQE